MKTRSKSKSSKKVHQNHHKPLKKMKSVKKQKPQKKNKVKSLRKNKVKSLKKKKKHFHKKSKRRNRKKKGGMPGKRKRDEDENAEEGNNQKKPNFGSCIICEENYDTADRAMQTTSCCGNNICKTCTITLCNAPNPRCPFCRNEVQFGELCSSMPSNNVRQVPHYSERTPETLRRWNEHVMRQIERWRLEGERERRVRQIEIKTNLLPTIENEHFKDEFELFFTNINNYGIGRLILSPYYDNTENVPTSYRKYLIKALIDIFEKHGHFEDQIFNVGYKNMTREERKDIINNEVDEWLKNHATSTSVCMGFLCSSNRRSIDDDEENFFNDLKNYSDRMIEKLKESIMKEYEAREDMM